MKIFTFFNCKGGVGKTTLIILLASYLAYVKHLRVIVVDMEKPDYRIRRFRESEIEQLADPSTPLARYASRNQMPDPSTYYTIQESGLTMYEYTPESIRDQVDRIADMKCDDEYDVALLDFPAGFAKGLPIYRLAEEGILDAVYVPHALESQERRSACRAALGLATDGEKVRLLWNNVDANIIRHQGHRLDEGEREVEFLKDYEVLYSPTRIKHFAKAAQETDEKCFVRTTVCWPDRYVRMWCPELIDLFEEIVNLLQL